jgi:hypothetical protein
MIEQLTRAELREMTPDQIARATLEGKCTRILRGESDPAGNRDSRQERHNGRAETALKKEGTR